VARKRIGYGARFLSIGARLSSSGPVRRGQATPRAPPGL